MGGECQCSASFFPFCILEPNPKKWCYLLLGWVFSPPLTNQHNPSQTCSETNLNLENPPKCLDGMKEQTTLGTLPIFLLLWHCGACEKRQGEQVLLFLFTPSPSSLSKSQGRPVLPGES